MVPFLSMSTFLFFNEVNKDFSPQDKQLLVRNARSRSKVNKLENCELHVFDWKHWFMGRQFAFFGKHGPTKFSGVKSINSSKVESTPLGIYVYLPDESLAI